MTAETRPVGEARAGQMVAWTQSSRVLERERATVCSVEEWHRNVVAACASGARLVGVFGWENGAELVAVVACDERNELGVVRAASAGGSFPTLTADLPAAQAFEREVFEVHGCRPVGHPWLKPLRRPAAADSFFRVEGRGVHEVAVGPVHAGIIEPGHFRFQCHGETVHHLEIQLGYQHRGVEGLLLRSAPARRLAISESVAGDTAIGHALAYCSAMEALGNVEVPLYAQAIRGIALELERIANHVGDLGALCNDVGYLPGASWFGRLRGDFLNLLAELGGNRFGRGLIRPGGVRCGLDAEQRRDILARLRKSERELVATAELVFAVPSVCSRFERTGVIGYDAAEALGLVGPVARASGCDRDVRRDHPAGVFRFAHIPVSLGQSGDVMARALVRWLETQRALTFVKEQIA
ncbi:MAG: NADH-quinone oxidoreductase subunit C, partial [Pseudomonadota bacterium]